MKMVEEFIVWQMLKNKNCSACYDIYRIDLDKSIESIKDNKIIGHAIIRHLPKNIASKIVAAHNLDILNTLAYKRGLFQRKNNGISHTIQSQKEKT